MVEVGGKVTVAVGGGGGMGVGRGCFEQPSDRNSKNIRMNSKGLYILFPPYDEHMIVTLATPV
jgi:hypothetical protein